MATLAILIFFTVTPRAEAQAQAGGFPYKKTFIITSYYTPLPGQSKYITGSFEGDVRLNGEGVHSADGTKVYPGMAASSREFPFGTKMELPGFGIVGIHDRGGAIKGNRLDIWVGHGEEGLSRALGWGMRTVEATVFGIDPNIAESVHFENIPLADLSVIPQRSAYFKADLGQGDSGMQVRELQRFLKKLGFFEGEAAGNFDTQTASAVSQFQLAQGVIGNLEDPAKGNFGPRSRYALQALLEKEKDKWIGRLPVFPFSRDKDGEAVGNLQKVLGEFGFLKSPFTGKFDDATVDALFRFQVDQSLVKHRTDFGAGFYGPKTKAAFETVVGQYFTVSEALLNPSQSKEPSSSFTKSLALGDRGNEVVVLQEELGQLNFWGLSPSGYFGKTTQHAVFKFQQAFNIVEDEQSEGAGVAGPVTQEKLKELAIARVEQKRLIAETTEKKKIIAQRVASEALLLVSHVANGAFTQDLSHGSRGIHVSSLQKILKRLGYFPGRFTTEYFGDITKKSLLAFQRNHGIAESGQLDSATRKIFNSLQRTL